MEGAGHRAGRQMFVSFVAAHAMCHDKHENQYVNYVMNTESLPYLIYANRAQKLLDVEIWLAMR